MGWNHQLENYNILIKFNLKVKLYEKSTNSTNETYTN